MATQRGPETKISPGRGGGGVWGVHHFLCSVKGEKGGEAGKVKKGRDRKRGRSSTKSAEKGKLKAGPGCRITGLGGLTPFDKGGRKNYKKKSGRNTNAGVQ